eukprot:GGOE01037532.1.p1 GENE.GGOE01037532.1~~GGOE01037532.1.p1  ORF type:complete len:455 (-),score=110.71 GGOE01037532.1:92-1456(-)
MDAGPPRLAWLLALAIALAVISFSIRLRRSRSPVHWSSWDNYGPPETSVTSSLPSATMEKLGIEDRLSFPRSAVAANSSLPQFASSTPHNSSARLRPDVRRCMADHPHFPDSALPPRGEPPVLVFITYPRTNILEPMFEGIRNVSQRYGFRAIRNRDTVNMTIPFRISINFEEPNGIFIEYPPGTAAQQQAMLWRREVPSPREHVFTMCPYSADWVNAAVGACRRTPMWQAVPPTLLKPFVPFKERLYDIMYMSGRTVNGPVHTALTEVFPGFKYRWVSSMRWKQFHSKVHCTDFKVSLDRRLFVTRMSRTALIVNALFFDTRIRTYRDYLRRPILRTHPAFAAFHTFNRSTEGGPLVLPQLKSRTFEAAMSGALMLVFNDGINVIEKYFVPGEEFLYWQNASDLRSQLEDVLAHPDRYESIARRAYEATLRHYTVERWVELLVVPFVRASQRH